MPNTRGFEVVAEVVVSVLREIFKAAWDNGGTGDPGSIPHEVVIEEGLMFGAYQVTSGQVSIPQDGLGLNMAPADNGITVRLATGIQVDLDPATIPVPSLSQFNMTADIDITAPFGIIPETEFNVGVIFEGLPRDKVSVALTSGDPIEPISDTLIAEYIHNLYEQNGDTFPHTITLEDQSWGAFTFDVFIELFDDLSDPARRIDVQRPDSHHVAISIPIHLRLSDIESALPVLSPMGVNARIIITAPYEQTSGRITANLSAAVVTVEDLASASGIEGSNYDANKAGAAAFGIDLDQLFITQITIQGAALVQGIGDDDGEIKIDYPTVAQIEQFIGDQVHQELLNRRYIGAWTPESPEGSPVEIVEVRPKALADALAIGINPGTGADENLLINFVPAAQGFAIALDADFVNQTIDEIIAAPEPDGFGGVPQDFNNIEGHDARLKSLKHALQSGVIHFWGDVTVYDVFCKADADCSFWADIKLRWIPSVDGSGGQTLEPYIHDDDVDLPWWAWLIAVLGFIFGLIIGIIMIVITIVIERVAERVGGAVMEGEVAEELQVFSAWPQELQGIGTVISTFQEAVGIDSDGLLFSGSIFVTAAYSLTLTDPACAGGPYSCFAGGLPIDFFAGPSNPKIDYHWNLGSGITALGHNASRKYDDNGLYRVRLTSTVNEPGGAITHNSVLVRAENVPPVVDAGEDKVVNEGEEVLFSGKFTDQEWPDTHEAIWDFGDDSLPIEGMITETNNPPQAEGVVTGSHAYCDQGEYTVTLRMRDDNGGVSEDTLKVTVLNVAPTVDAGEDMFAYACTPITLVGRFFDPGWCDTHIGSWNFGDCTPTHPAIIREKNEPPMGTGIVVATHTYNRCGTYWVECVVIDDDGGVGRDVITVRVVDVLNRDFESGFRNLKMGTVANHWEPYPDSTSTHTLGMVEAVDVSTAFFNAEEFVVHGGQRSQKIEGVGKFSAGIYQRVGANLDWDYQVSVWYHIDERTGGKCRLGIDPLGGTNPASADVEWVEGNQRHNWAQLVWRVTAKKRAITIFLEVVGETQNTAAYFDDVVLSPYPCPLKEPEIIEQPEPESREICVNWAEEKKGGDVGTVYEKNGFIFKSVSQETLRIIIWGSPEGQGKLAILQEGMQVLLPFVADAVIAHVGLYSRHAIILKALDAQGNTVGEAFTPAAPGESYTLEINTGGIASLFFSGGGGEGLLLNLCISEGAEGKKSPLKQIEDVKKELTRVTGKIDAKLKRKRMKIKKKSKRK